MRCSQVETDNTSNSCVHQYWNTGNIPEERINKLEIKNRRVENIERQY